ncbi:hypothetical protein L0F63_004502, partial [Massospora cicadina]
LHRRNTEEFWGEMRFIHQLKGYQRDQDGIHMKRANCTLDLVPSCNSSIPCFAIAAGHRHAIIKNSPHIPPQRIKGYHSHNLKLFNLLYWITGSADETNKLLKDGVDFAVAVSAKNQLCRRVFSEPEALSDTILGPGRIVITERQMDSVTEGWRVGAAITFSTSPLSPYGSVTASVDTEYRKSIITTTKSILSREFVADQDQTCTPTIVFSSINCLPTSANILLGKGGLVFNYSRVEVKNTLIPIRQGSLDFFNPMYGCIDY